MDMRVLRETGTVGLVSGILLVVVNLLHPIGNTEMYADGVKFVAKMDTFWVILHLVIAVALLPVPMVVRGWVGTLSTERGRLWGDFGLTLIVMGTVIGSIHLAGIDGVALPAFGNVLRAPGASPELKVAAAALLKVHLTTFISWVVVFWMAGQAALAFASFRDPQQPRGLAVLAVLGAAFALASVLTTALAGQLTTLSEGGLFRPSTVAFTIFYLWISFRLRRIHAAAVAPR
jgi:hypothetical protein